MTLIISIDKTIRARYHSQRRFSGWMLPHTTRAVSLVKSVKVFSV